MASEGPIAEDRSTFLLVTPDGIVTGRLGAILERLRDDGFEPRVGRLLHLETEVMLRLYGAAGDVADEQPPVREVFDHWYGLGPAALLVVHRAEGGASRALCELKGPTDPALAPARAIRHAGENTLTNLVHCPDDAAAARWELAQLVGTAAAEQLWRAAERGDGRITGLTVETLEDALPARGGVAALSVPLILNRLRLRLLQHLAVDRHHDAAVLRELADIRDELRGERHALAATATSAERLEIARARHAAIQQRLEAVASGCADPALAEAARRMGDALAPSVDQRCGIVAATVAAGLVVSQHERAALQIHAHVG